MVYLVNFVEGVIEMLWDEMKVIMFVELEVVFKVRKWFNVDFDNVEVDEEWFGCFEKLIDF